MLEKSTLFKRLKNLEADEFSSGSNPVSSKITEELLNQSRDILSRVSQYLPDYTLHDIQHSCRVLENIENIIPSTVNLDIVEIKILIYSVFLHDIGMTSDKIEEKLFNDYLKEPSTERKEKLLKKYIKSIKKKNVLDNNLIKDFSKLLKIELTSYTNNDFSEYIRANHVRRSKMKLFLLKKNMDFEYKGRCLLNHIYDVILSHGLNFSDLANENRYPIEEIISNKKVNILFISTLLRLGDLLDADISRTPKYVYDFFQFEDKKSESKWEKNLSLVGKQVTNYNVSFNYMSISPEQERDIRKYIEFVEKQILNTNKILKYSTKKLNLSPIINLTVRNNGSYKSADKQITIEYDKVKKILMGLELYDNETMFLRELIQNARDACKMREFYCEKLNINYSPKILISFDEDERLLIVKDNGIGMNESSINNFFIKIGNSSYASKNFYKDYGFNPIGHFGIGIFSAFMASDEIDVNSIRFKENGFFDQPVNIKLKIDEKYVIDYETDKNVHEGTQISMRLNDSIKKLNKEFIVEKIKNTVSNFFDIPIYFGENIIHENKTIDKVKAEDDEIIINKKGLYKLKIKFTKRKKEDYLFSSNKDKLELSYNGISIGDIHPNRHAVFLPYWFHIESGYIEIDGNIPLSLKASRDEIIENKVSEGIYNQINNDLFNQLIENKQERYISKDVYFNEKTIGLEKSFHHKINLQVYKDGKYSSMKIIDIIEQYSYIYVLSKQYIKNKSFIKTKLNENSIIVLDKSKYVTSIKSILVHYVENVDIILEKNTFLYQKIKIDFTRKKDDYHEGWNDGLFSNFNNKKILFLMDSTGYPSYKINKNHKFGKLLYKNREQLTHRNIYDLMHGVQKNKKNDKHNIPYIFLRNLSKEIDSKRHIKHINKRLKLLTDELDIPQYTVSTKDFLKSIFKI